MQFYQEREGQVRSLWLSNIKDPRNIFKINISPAISSYSATAKTEAVAPAGAMLWELGEACRGGEKGKAICPRA